MSLIVEDGSGRTDAESPQSVASVDAYAALRATSRRGAAAANAWLALDFAAKEETCRRAALAQEDAYSYRVSGSKANRAQALSFPRFSGYDLSGNPYPSGSVTDWWKAIHAEMCMRDALRGLMPDQERSRVTSFSFGPLGNDLEGYSETLDSSAGTGTDYRVIDAIGSRFLRPAGEITW